MDRFGTRNRRAFIPQNQKTYLVLGLFALFAVFMVLISGCGNQQPREYQEPMYNWSMTDDGTVKYRWTGEGSCVLQYYGKQTLVPRTTHTGFNNAMSWEWEDDGDLDITINNREYDLDSPYDFDYEYQEDGNSGAGAFIGGLAAGSILSGKKHKVYGYDAHGNPLDKKGKIIPTLDAKGKPVKLYDSKGKLITDQAKTTTATKKNISLEAQLKASQEKTRRQAAELTRQQEAHRKKNNVAKKSKKTKHR